MGAEWMLEKCKRMKGMRALYDLAGQANACVPIGKEDRRP